jgi:hypothetical protein
MIGSFNSTTGLTAAYDPLISYPTGFQIGFIQLNSARISLTGTNVNIHQAYNFYKTTQKYSTATLYYTGSVGGWILFGDLSL